MTTPKLRQVLDKEHVKYQIINHLPAYTAQQIAEAAHITGREMAKTVMIKADGKLVMIVWPATEKLNLSKIKQLLKAKALQLATEDEFKKTFPECEVGAMPPFGNLYGIEVYASDLFTKSEKIAFNGGSHTEIVKMAWKDYDKLVHPHMLRAA